MNNVERAIIRGMDATMQAAVLKAKGNHPWNNRTGNAERSIQVVQPARKTAGSFLGKWGSKGIRYFARLEFGFSGSDSRGRSFNQRPRPSLGPAKRSEYPKLIGRIRSALGI